MNQSNTNPWWGIIGTREMGFRRSYQPFVALIGPSFPNSIDVFFWWVTSMTSPSALKNLPAGSLRTSSRGWGQPGANSAFGCHGAFPIGGLEHGWIIFPYIGNDHPNWLSYFSEGWLNHQPVSVLSWRYPLFSSRRRWLIETTMVTYGDPASETSRPVGWIQPVGWDSSIHESIGSRPSKPPFLDHGTYGYGSIPINTIFRGMNIHLPAILMFTRGTRFWHTAISRAFCR